MQALYWHPHFSDKNAILQFQELGFQKQRATVLASIADSDPFDT
jgi:hypothetical protein